MSCRLDGDCHKYKKKFYIRINRDLDEPAAIDTLLHEWAHARAWNHLLDSAETNEHFETFSHDASWGVAYSEVYRVYEKYIFNWFNQEIPLALVGEMNWWKNLVFVHYNIVCYFCRKILGSRLTILAECYTKNESQIQDTWLVKKQLS